MRLSNIPCDFFFFYFDTCGEFPNIEDGIVLKIFSAVTQFVLGFCCKNMSVKNKPTYSHARFHCEINLSLISPAEKKNLQFGNRNRSDWVYLGGKCDLAIFLCQKHCPCLYSFAFGRLFIYLFSFPAFHDSSLPYVFWSFLFHITFVHFYF